MKSLTRSIRLLSLLICMSLLPFGQGALAADNIPSAAPSVLNAGFEEPVTGEKIPGWSLTFGAGYSDMSYEVTSADAYEGNYSLLLDDRNTSRALGLESDPFPITPGAQYIVSAMMKVERSNLAIYIRYFDADGVKLGETSNWLASTDGQWVRNSAFTKAPDDAVTATILLYSSSTGTGRGYMDQIMIGEVQMGTFEQIGSVVNGSINLTGTVGMENGTHVMYTVYKGRDDVPTSFVVIDVLTREVLKTFPMPGVESAWAVEVATDGSVYIGTHYNGGLYRYSPDDGSFEHIGRFGNETHVWAMAPGPDGKIYAGTYPNAKVYEYDPADGQIKDLGRPEPTEKYVRSMAYDAERNELYVGVGGTRSKVFKMNVEDGTYKELLSGLLPDGGESYAFPYGMKFAEDRLFVKFSNGDLLVIRGEDEALEYYNPDGIGIHSETVVAVPDQPGRVMFTYNGNIYVYDAASASISLVKEVMDGHNFHTGKFVELNHDDWPGWTLVASGRGGHIVYYNPATDRADILPSHYSGSPILIQSIHAGPDGKMYVAGYMSGFASYDPLTGEISETRAIGQIESSAIRDGKLLIGAYAGGRILEYDPNQPWSRTNPQPLFDLRSHGQDRPFAMVYAEDRDELYVGTVPDTTSLEGALSTYNFATGELDVYSNIIPNQSIVSLVYKDGLVYGGSTIYGGLGTDGPVESEGKLFIFDPETKSKIFETVPVAGRRGVTGLTVGPDGMIWGIAEDHIFTFNPDTRTVETSISKLKRYGSSTTWAYGFLRTGIDGNVYGTSRGQFFMVKPDSMDFIMLNGSIGNYLNQDKYGNFYFSDNSSNLWKYTPPMREELLQSLLDQSYEKGWIRQQGILNSLQVKLKNNNLTDFIREVQAQRGKHVTEDAASLFIYLAERLVNYK